MSTLRSFSSLSHNMSGLQCIQSVPLAGLLYKSVAWLGNMGLIGVCIICERHIYVSINIIAFLHGSFHRFYACLYLSIALMVV